MVALIDAAILTGNTATQPGPFLGQLLSISRDVGQVTGTLTVAHTP